MGIVPYKSGDAAPYWLLQVALAGVLDRMHEPWMPQGELDSTRGKQGRVAQLLGWDDGHMSHFLTDDSGPKPPLWMSKPQELHGKLLEFQHLAHVLGAQAPPNTPISHESRQVLLTDLWARLCEQPQRAELHAPPVWFKDLALTLSPDVERPAAPVMVIAAGQSLVANIDQRDRAVVETFRRGAKKSTARAAKANRLVPTTLQERETIADELSAGQGLVDHTVAALLEVARLPPSLYGTEAMMLLGRLRLPSVLHKIDECIRTNGVGFRLWRAFSMYLKAERFMLEALPDDLAAKYIDDGSAIGHFDAILLRLLNSPLPIDAYPARSLPIETIEQRLKLYDVQDARDLQGGNGHGQPGADSVAEVCTKTLESRIKGRARPERERAYAALVLERRTHTTLEIDDVNFRMNGLLHHALSAISRDTSSLPDKASVGDDQTIRSCELQVAKWIESAVFAADRSGDYPIPDKLLADQKKTDASADEPDPAWKIVGQSALAAMIFTLVRDYDGVWRRRVADAIRCGMLSNVVASILARFLGPEELKVHGERFEPLPWMRELAVLGISFLRPYNNDHVIETLLMVGGSDEDLVVNDDDPRAPETHAALWALAEFALYQCATRRPNDRVQRSLGKVRDHFVTLARKEPQGSIERAVAYGLLCLEWLDIEDADYVVTCADVRQAIANLQASATDPTVKAIVGNGDDDGCRPAIARAVGR